MSAAAKLTSFHRLLFLLFLFAGVARPQLSPAPSPSPSPSPPTPSSDVSHLAPVNPRLELAYIALQAWKHAITDDPHNFTGNWCGPFVCDYNGVFCAAAPDDPHILTVAGVDLNHARLAGTLPDHLALLSDLALLHLNTNRFRGCLPETLIELHRLYELDVSNNRLSGPFPSFLLRLPSLRFLDIRFNRFAGELPQSVFNSPLDALFVNNNRFNISLTAAIGNSTASVLVLANSRVSTNGCIPGAISRAAKTLNQLVLLNSGIEACIPPELGDLDQLTLLDLGGNRLVGQLPESIGRMRRLEQLDVSGNLLTGEVPEAVCELPRLKNLTISDNYFCGEPEKCGDIPRRDDNENCIPWRPDQRPPEECAAFFSLPPANCDPDGCIVPPSSPPPALAPSPAY